MGIMYVRPTHLAFPPLKRIKRDDRPVNLFRSLFSVMPITISSE